MRRRRKRKKNTPSEVELNLAAMLDMAFQLLAFFIFTFDPAPVEAQISLRIPTMSVTSSSGAQADTETEKEDFGLTLNLRVLSNAAGDVSGFEVETQKIAISGDPAKDIAALNSQLTETLKGASFDSIVIHFADDLVYERMVQVLSTCAQLKKADGEPFTNISITSLKR